MGILLIGASGLAREVLGAGLEDVTGVLDDDPAAHLAHCGGVVVRGGLDEAVRRPQDQLLICIGPGRARRDVVRRLADAGVGPERFATFVAPSARIGRGVAIGRGSILLDGVVVTADARVGAHVVVMPHGTITHDDTLADHVTLAAGVSLGGGVAVGEAAYIGMNASVHPGVSIGHDATVGMGAAVLRDVPDGETWVGVPARPLRSAVRAMPARVDPTLSTSIREVFA
ncbi:acetyltransferase [Microbacterium stercoris]|nr:acetyltransferase [Microbacterium stercoris]